MEGCRHQVAGGTLQPEAASVEAVKELASVLDIEELAAPGKSEANVDAEKAGVNGSLVRQESSELNGQPTSVGETGSKDKGKSSFLKKGQEVELYCESLAFKGKGVCKVTETGFVILCDGALPGERLIARVVKKSRNMAEAVKLQTLEPHKHAVEAPCVHFAHCGGCKTQNLAYEAQLAIKQEQVEELAVRTGGFERGGGWMLPIVGCDQQYHYRNKMEFSFSNRVWLAGAPGRKPRRPPGTPYKPREDTEPKGFALGLHAPGRFDKVLPIGECLLQHEAGNRILTLVQDWALANQETCPPYDTVAHTGFLRHLTIRKGSHAETGGVQIMVNMMTRDDCPELLTPLVDLLTSKVPEIATVVNTVNASSGCGSQGQLEHVLFGEGFITETLRGLHYEISASSFFQTNTHQAEVLYKMVEEACALKGEKSGLVLDLFCGTGTIGLSVAKKVRQVVGYEIVPEAVADARRNAERNNIENATFVQGDLNKLKDDFAQGLQPDIVITDPNRPGMHPKLLKFLSSCGARRIIYVSCNPATMARDLDVLCHGEKAEGEDQQQKEGAYRLVTVQPVDMFPHTAHVESVAVLERVQ